jgi:hypothetical protein
MLRWLWELPVLVAVNLMVSFVSLWEYLRVVGRYYRNTAFRRADLALLWQYCWNSPYKVHKRFLQEHGEVDVYRYGETPLTTIDLLTQRANVTADDVYVELGCGRGRTCLWMRTWIGCQTVGIDYVPAFIERANAVVQAQQLEGIAFLCRDFLQEPWEKGTVFYVDATLFEDTEIAQLIRRFDALPPGSRVIGVNLTLVSPTSDENSLWREEQRFTASYPWGQAEVAIFQRIGKGEEPLPPKG